MTGCSERWTLLLPDKKPCLVGRQTMNYDYEGKYSTSHGRREREGQDEGEVTCRWAGISLVY